MNDSEEPLHNSLLHEIKERADEIDRLIDSFKRRFRNSIIVVALCMVGIITSAIMHYEWITAGFLGFMIVSAIISIVQDKLLRDKVQDLIEEQYHAIESNYHHEVEKILRQYDL